MQNGYAIQTIAEKSRLISKSVMTVYISPPSTPLASGTMTPHRSMISQMVENSEMIELKTQHIRNQFPWCCKRAAPTGKIPAPASLRVMWITAVANKLTASARRTM
mmetsp:Transcript_39188/g.63792  ORF Transcript_39188/g.63792 Transcript_39188/m.63792 type:complete len:106 (+) Transcript_39188:60-377(+)